MECVRCKTPLPDYARFCLTCGMDVSGDPLQHTVAETDPTIVAKLQEDLGTDFLIERELGRGGMAIVYLAQDVHIGRKVAIKVLPPELTFAHGQGFVDRFKREARTAGALEHPNIIPIHRVSTDGKMFWYIMKYIEGESLDAVLKREAQLPLRRAGDILAAVADALDHAHKKGVIHRDIKPANVLLDGEGKVTVTDFGIAKAFHGESLTVSGSILGTPYYMSPEQCAGKTVSGAADQYSLGVMAYQMLSGHLPFTGESAVEIIKKHTLDQPPPLGVLRPGIPEGTVRAIERAMAKNAEDRFPSARSFVHAIEFPSDEQTSPMTPGERAASMRVIASTPGPGAASAELMPTQATPLPRFSSTLVMRKYAALRARIDSMVSRFDIWATAFRERMGPGLEAAFTMWRGLDLRARALSTVALAVTLVALLVVAWPDGDAPAGASDPPLEVPGAPATSATRDSASTPAVSGATPAAHPFATPADSSALLRIRTRPAGASVTIDGAARRGDSARLDPGRHIVAVARPGYRTRTDTLVLRAGESMTRTMSLTALAASAPQSAPAGPAAAPDSRPAGGGGGLRAIRVPSSLSAAVLTVPERAKVEALANGYAEADMNLFSASCARFVGVFWDVMGYGVDLTRLCAASAIIRVPGNVPDRWLNFTRFVRTRDGAIETVERPAETAELRNEVTGKRLRFRLRGDSLVITDETPEVPVVRPTTQRAQRSVSVKPAAGGAPAVVRIDAFGPVVKSPRDSLPVWAAASHPHRVGACDGTLTFDGETLRFIPDRGSHTLTFTAPGIIDGTVVGQRGAIRIRASGGTERLTLQRWETLFEAVVAARLR